MCILTSCSNNFFSFNLHVSESKTVHLKCVYFNYHLFFIFKFLAQEVDLSALYSCVNKHRAEPVHAVPVISKPETVLYHEPEIGNGYDDEDALYCQPEEFMRSPVQVNQYIQDVTTPEMIRNNVSFILRLLNC